MPTIWQVRAFTVRGGGADYHDQADGHWIDGHIATPMARYPEYRRAAQVVRHRRARLPRGRGRGERRHRRLRGDHRRGNRRVHRRAAPRPLRRGQAVTEIEQDVGPDVRRRRCSTAARASCSTRSPASTSRSGTCSARCARSPCSTCSAAPVRDELMFYATGARPDLAKEHGLHRRQDAAASTGRPRASEGLRKNLATWPTMRERVGEDFWLMYDCWMSLDLDYATRLADGGARPRPQVDRGVPAARTTTGATRNCARTCPDGMLVTTGEHEATRWGFRMLLEMGCCDIMQPDVGWCGGMTELIKISALADAHGVLVVPHGSSVYSYHFVVTRHNSPFAEFLMMSPKADRVVPMFTPLLLDEPVPVGRAPEDERARCAGFRRAHRIPSANCSARTRIDELRQDRSETRLGKALCSTLLAP